MKKKILFILPVLIIVVGLAVMQFLSSFKTPPAKKPPEKAEKLVRTEKVVLSNIPVQIIAYGRVVSARPVTLYSEVQGTLEQGDQTFQPGQLFKKGQLLIKIDDRQNMLDINKAKSDLLNALASVLPEIKIDFPEEYPRWQKCFDNCGFDCPVPDLPKANNNKIKLYLSRFNIYKIYFTIRNLEILHEKHFLYAPFYGSIVSTALRVGSNARPGTRLGEIISLEDLEVEMPVTATDIQWITLNQPAILTSSEISGRWSGQIIRVGKTIDSRTQTAQIYIAVEQGPDKKLYDGVFMKAEIPGREIQNAVKISRQALYNQKFVYVVQNKKLSRRDVHIARNEPDYVIVDSGLENEDMLVTDLLQGVVAGMPVRVVKNREDDKK